MTRLGEEDPLPHDSAHGLNSGRQELGPPRPPPPTPMWEGGRAMWGARAPSEAGEAGSQLGHVPSGHEQGLAAVATRGPRCLL